MCVVSVLMPVFNGMPFVKEALDSILSQSLKDFEFIIIDDGSTDGTVDFLQSLMDSRLRIVFKESHVGIF
jgi:glycosyltransferase involved in cell wall biosynthesis